MAPKTKVTIAIALILFCVIFPTIIASRSGVGESVFGGFLFNPLDGNSYLAKMQQGFQGGWQFHLTYSPQSGNGAFIFLFYLALGHLARLTGSSLIWIFHIARVAAALSLLVVLWSFFKWISQEDENAAWRCFLWAALGSGLGWLTTLATGYISGDFWIAEAYPFLSMYANPHFPLGLALVLGICLLVFRKKQTSLLFIPFLSLILAVVQPINIVILALPLVGYLVASPKSVKLVDCLYVTAAMLPGGLFLIYQYFSILGDPILAEWNRQNVTLTPPVWDIVLSFSPALLFAIPGAALAWRSGLRTRRMLVFWLAAGLLLIYIPFNLQRRFLVAMYVPVVGLAVPMLMSAVDRMRRPVWIWPAVLTVSLLTNLLVIVSGSAAAASRDPILYLTREETIGLQWLGENTPRDAVVLSSPRLGMFIPAWSGRSVVYGHPFESLRAEQIKPQVEDFLSGKIDETRQLKFIEENGIDYYLVNLDEAINSAPRGSEEVFQNDGISILALHP
jgi:hypothetical protein